MFCQSNPSRGRGHGHGHPKPYALVSAYLTPPEPFSAGDLAMKTRSKYPAEVPLQKKAAAAFYSILGGSFAFVLVRTLTAFPMLPFQPSSAPWCKAWLATTVFDYYGAALCLCGVILSTERQKLQGILWSLGCCLLGTPVCCLWVVQRLLRGGSLRIAS